MATMENLIGTDLGVAVPRYNDNNNHNKMKDTYLLKTRGAKEDEDPNYAAFLTANPSWTPNWLPDSERYPSVRYINRRVTTDPTIINNYMSGSKFYDYPSQWRGVTGLQIRSLDNQEQAVLLSVLTTLGDTSAATSINPRFPTGSTTHSPGTPTINNMPVTLNETAATFNFSPPTVSPGFGLGPIGGFKYTLYLGSIGTNPAIISGVPQQDITLSGTATSISLTGLTANTEYRIVIKATGTSGVADGLEDSLIFRTPAAGSPPPPVAPVAATISSPIVKTDTTATVTFTGGVSGVTYTYTLYTGTTTATVTSLGGVPQRDRTIASGATSISLTGLTANTTYSVVIKATGGTGLTTDSSLSSFTTNAAAVAAPNNPSITTGSIAKTDTTITVPFSHGSATDTFTYTVNSGAAQSLAAGARSISLTGLRFSTSHAILLKAVNTAGTPSSGASTTVTTAPRKVTINSITTIAQTTATVPFTGGGETGVTYTYTLYTGTTTAIVTTLFSVSQRDRTIASGATSISLTGLTANTTYSVVIKAASINGNTDSSLSSFTTTPGQPTITGITAFDGTGTALVGTVSVNFTAPSGGAAPISNYEYSTNNGLSYTELATADTSSPLTIPSLTPGIEYQIKIKAVNNTGPGLASATMNITPHLYRFYDTGFTLQVGTLVGPASSVFNEVLSGTYKIYLDTQIYNATGMNDIKTNGIDNDQIAWLFIKTPTSIYYLSLRGSDDFIVLNKRLTTNLFWTSNGAVTPAAPATAIYSGTTTTIYYPVSITNVGNTKTVTRGIGTGGASNLAASLNGNKALFKPALAKVAGGILGTGDVAKARPAPTIAGNPLYFSLAQGGSKTAPHKKTRNNRNNFKNTRKNK